MEETKISKRKIQPHPVWEHRYWNLCVYVCMLREQRNKLLVSLPPGFLLIPKYSK